MCRFNINFIYIMYIKFILNINFMAVGAERFRYGDYAPDDALWADPLRGLILY
jgi:hypothetical protein